jgi:hypothetical protein
MGVQLLGAKMPHRNSTLEFPGRALLLEREVMPISDVHCNHVFWSVRVDGTLFVEQLANDLRIRDDNDIGVQHLEGVDRSILLGPFLEPICASVS